MERTNSGRKRTMLIAATILDQTRRMAGALVERAERDVGSRMSAYERVATTIGVSASWLRKFVRGYVDVKGPSFVAGLKIIDQYETLVRRIDAAANLEKARAEVLWGMTKNAHDKSIAAMVQILEAEESGGEGAGEDKDECLGM